MFHKSWGHAGWKVQTVSRNLKFFFTLVSLGLITTLPFQISKCLIWILNISLHTHPSMSFYLKFNLPRNSTYIFNLHILSCSYQGFPLLTSKLVISLAAKTILNNQLSYTKLTKPEATFQTDKTQFKVFLVIVDTD